MCSLKSFYLKIENKNNENIYDIFPDCYMTYNNQITLNKKHLALLYTDKSNTVYEFTFHKIIKNPLLFKTNNPTINFFLNKKPSYSPYKILPIDTTKDYYIFNITNHIPSFVIYSFFEKNNNKPSHIKKEYIFNKYIKIPKKDNYITSMLLYYKYA